MSCLFGPVRSRRLGQSLGIDLVLPKTCNLDCIFCECGRTTHLTLDCQSFVPLETVITEIDSVLKKQPALDYITYSGHGEPTLSCDLGTISTYIRQTYPMYRQALITNSTILHRDDVLDRLSAIDVILPSLHAVDDTIFQMIARPHPRVHVNDLIHGLEKLKARFAGQIWLEVFIAEGINDQHVLSEAFINTIHNLKPTAVHLNSLDRPGTESWVKTVHPDRLRPLIDALRPIPTEIVHGSAGRTKRFQPSS